MNIYSQSDLQLYFKNQKVLFSIDRFEGKFAVCENKLTNEMINISKELLPSIAKNGDILKIENSLLTIDLEETKKEKLEVKNLVDNLFKKKSP